MKRISLYSAISHTLLQPRRLKYCGYVQPDRKDAEAPNRFVANMERRSIFGESLCG